MKTDYKAAYLQVSRMLDHYQDVVVPGLRAQLEKRVMVIRCKDCGWYRLENETCSFWPDEGYRSPDHYCGEGRPR